MTIILNWLISAVAILATVYLLPGVTLVGFTGALIVALVLGLLNAFIRPLLMFLTLPINVLTLGLFTLVINALLIMLTGALVTGFQISGFGTAFVFAIILSIVLYILHLIVPDRFDRPIQ